MSVRRLRTLAVAAVLAVAAGCATATAPAVEAAGQPRSRRRPHLGRGDRTDHPQPPPVRPGQGPVAGLEQLRVAAHLRQPGRTRALAGDRLAGRAGRTAYTLTLRAAA